MAIQKVITIYAGEKRINLQQLMNEGMGLTILFSSTKPVAMAQAKILSLAFKTEIEYLQILSSPDESLIDKKSTSIVSIIEDPKYREFDSIIIVGHQADQYMLPVKVIEKIGRNVDFIPFGHGINEKPGGGSIYNIGVCCGSLN